MEVPFLGELPINMQIRMCGDQGAIARIFDDETSRSYLDHVTLELARNLAQRVQQSPTLPSLTVI